MQSIDFAHDDAHVRLARRLPVADDPGGGRILLATSRDVLLLEPVALEQQVTRAPFDVADVGVCSMRGRGCP